MTPAKKNPPKENNGRVLLTDKELRKAIADLANEIHQEFPDNSRLVLLGIRTRGVYLAERIKAHLDKKYSNPVATGVIDITFYRDDLSRTGPNPMVRGSELPFDVTDALVVLVDDVLYTGRTIRAAMDEIGDFGRPSLIRLAVVVDRGLREIPIQPDYCALRAETKPEEIVQVLLDETDDEDMVRIVARP